MSVVSYTAIRFPDGNNTRKGSIMIKIKVYMILLKKFNTTAGTPGTPGTGILRIEKIICRKIYSITENGNTMI